MDGGESKTFQVRLPAISWSVSSTSVPHLSRSICYNGQKRVLLSTLGFLKTCHGQLNIKAGVKAYLL